MATRLGRERDTLETEKWWLERDKDAEIDKYGYQHNTRGFPN